MPVHKDPPRRVGITVVRKRVRIKPPLGQNELDALRAKFASSARAPLVQELEQLKDRIGARLEALGFSPVLGFYEIDDPEGIEPGAPGSWRAAPAGADVEEPQGDAAPPATARHPALLRRHEGTVPWLLAKALLNLTEVQAQLRGTRPLDAEDLARASYRLGDLLRQASFKFDHEDLVLRGERDEEARRRGGQESGWMRRAAREEDRPRWRAEAAEFWKLHPKWSVRRVALHILSRLKSERVADDARWVPTDRTIRDEIADLRPEGPLRRRAKSLEAN